ncbi:hypothetical protein GCM10022379_23590 [Micromonospora maritima]
MTGMPIGAPAHVPEPKSACTVAPAPIAPTIAADRAWTGNRETSACQTLSAGKTVHAPAPALGRAPIPVRAAGTGDLSDVVAAPPGGTVTPGAAPDVAVPEVAVPAAPSPDAAGSLPDVEQPAVTRASTATTAAWRGRRRSIPAILPQPALPSNHPSASPPPRAATRSNTDRLPARISGKASQRTGLA